MDSSRPWVLPAVIAASMCSALLATFTVSLARVELHYAMWTKSQKYLPALAEAFAKVYLAGLVLPLVTVFLGLLLCTKKLTNPVAISSWIGFLAVMHIGWLFFSLVALYLMNQTFVA